MRHRLQRLAEHMVATDQRASKKRLSCESFCRMAAFVSSTVIASRLHGASCACGHAGHNLNTGISQPPRQMAIPFKRCSLFCGAGTWME
jgi:hypothetical protein